MKTNVMNEITKCIEKINEERNVKLGELLLELQAGVKAVKEAMGWTEDTVKPEKAEKPETESIPKEESSEKPKKREESKVSYKDIDPSILDGLKDLGDKIKVLYKEGLRGTHVKLALREYGETASDHAIDNWYYRIRSQEQIAEKYSVSLDAIDTLRNVFFRKKDIRLHPELFKIAGKETGLDDKTIEKIMTDIKEKNI